MSAARITITKRTLDALKPPAEDLVLWDRSLKGFGIRCAPTGTIGFLVQYRNAQGRSRRITIGPYGAYTPAKARAEAERLLSEAKAARHGWADARDPADRRQEERRAITFAALADEYMQNAEKGLIQVKGKPKKASTLTIDKYRIKHLTAHFGKQTVKSITTGDCQKCVQALIAGRNGAARTFGLLGGILTYAKRMGYIHSNPAHGGVDKPADTRREFRLDVDGYRALGKALEAAEKRMEPWQGVGAIRLLALTGARKSEVLRLMISEVDFRDRCLRLGDTKTGASTRALGEPALRLLRAIIKRPGRPHSPHVFPGRDPRKPFVGLDGAWKRIVGNAYSPHGLRHAFASTCHDHDLSEITIAYLLGHASARTGSTTRGYIKLDAVLLAAGDRVSRGIWEAMTGEAFSAEIVEMPRTAANSS